MVKFDIENRGHHCVVAQLIHNNFPTGEAFARQKFLRLAPCPPAILACLLHVTVALLCIPKSIPYFKYILTQLFSTGYEIYGMSGEIMMVNEVYRYEV
jgi:hypothetical protein